MTCVLLSIKQSPLSLPGLKAPQSSLAELKGQLLKSAAGVNRGLSCREGERREIVSIVEQLEVC